MSKQGRMIAKSRLGQIMSRLGEMTVKSRLDQIIMSKLGQMGGSER